jgi:hypothetical protein
MIGVIASATFSLIWGVACSVILRSKSRFEKWTVAANLIFTLVYFPAMYWDWRGIQLVEFYLVFTALNAIFGFTIFRFPYYGLRYREDPGETGDAKTSRMPQLEKSIPENETSTSQDPDGEASPLPTSNMARGIMAQYATRLLAICRTAYCCGFFTASGFGIYASCLAIAGKVLSHSQEPIWGNAIIGLYAAVWGIAWWMIFRERPQSKRWAIVANLIIIFNYLPAMVTGQWRAFFKAELQWWPFILLGIFGIIIFSIPYHGSRNKQQIMAT